MSRLTAVLLVLLFSSGAVCALPQDAFQRTAAKALRGDFGKLATWQEKGYRLGVARGGDGCRNDPENLLLSALLR